ncbi:MAG: tryptophan synthase subunit beta [Bacteroidaceae bacterium]|nr:tryptophan synthase subunit beta [Bacteroidaceae bacterium]
MKTQTTNFEISEQGYYGNFGGAFVSEQLMNCTKQLAADYLKYINDADFQQEFRELLHDYVGRPTPLYRSEKLSQMYGCTIYLKREDLNHTGAHKINNAIGQALMAKRRGARRIVAETGAGQHGVATATACALLNLDCTIFMGAEDIVRQHSNVQKMKLLGARIVSVTEGSGTLENAVDAALREWSQHPEDTYYLLGSAVGPHPFPDMVMRFQSIISEEMRQQLLTKEGKELPDYVIACIGGGSNATGSFSHFLNDLSVRLVLVEAAGRGIESGQTAASLSCGKECVLHGANTLVLTDENGTCLGAYSISAGLDYPGVGPLPAHLVASGRADVIAITDEEALRAAYEVNKLEGILPALESAHALAALKKIDFKPEDIVVLTLSGRGDKDLETYIQYIDLAK